MSKRVLEGLPPSFHQSFLPERRHLSSLLELANKRFEGTLKDISEASGIPTGRSSGKVLPHIKYAKAMGLIESSDSNGGTYLLMLSPLGVEVHKEDSTLHEYLTQLILHLMLARPVGGAMVWHVLFGQSGVSLGQLFSSEAATSFITSILGKSSSVPGPLFSTYREESSLARSGVLASERNELRRSEGPVNTDLYWGIAYCWLNYWENTAPSDMQLALSSLEGITGFQDVIGWSKSQYDGFLAWAADHTVARVDRLTGEPLIVRTASSLEIIARIYSELI